MVLSVRLCDWNHAVSLSELTTMRKLTVGFWIVFGMYSEAGFVFCGCGPCRETLILWMGLNGISNDMESLSANVTP